MKYLRKLHDTVSFDFDGVLHSSVIGLNPINWDKPKTWKPRLDMFEKLRKEAETHKVVIVSARDQWMKPYIEEFISMHNLPVSEIFCTDDEPKKEILKSVKAIRHYDDNPATSVPEDTKLILVKPLS